MTDFANKYTNANIAQDAAAYDRELFLRLHATLSNLVPSESLATAIIVIRSRNKLVEHFSTNNTPPFRP